MRHAKSSWKNGDLIDFERPLNKRGEKDAPMMGGRLKNLDEKIDAIFTSPANRALTTAKIVGKILNIFDGSFFSDKNIYGAGVNDLLSAIKNFDDKFSSVILLGHNPGLTLLQNKLTSKYIDNIPTAGIVKIKIDVNFWKDVTTGSGKMEFFDYPKKK